MSNEHAPEPEGEYVDEPLDEARCPECGNEDGITKTVAKGNVQPIPPDHRTSCPECDHAAHALAFHSAWQWERMSEEERREAEEQVERYASKMAAHQESAAYLSEQREP